MVLGLPSGELSLTLENTWGTRHLWRDGKRQQLEQLLNDVIEGLILASLQEQERRAERERKRIAEAEAERQRKELEQQRREERARIRRLERLLAATQRHERLERLVHQLSELVQHVDADIELARWLAWAQEHVRQSDPLRPWRSPDTLLTLYHPAFRSELESILATGFRERSVEPDEDQELPPSVLLGDVPLTRGYDSVSVKVTIPESAVLPYESLNEQRSYRRFLVPAAVVRRYATVSIDDDGA